MIDVQGSDRPRLRPWERRVVVALLAWIVVCLAAALVAVLTGCAGVVEVSPAPDPHAGTGLRFVARTSGEADFQGFAEQVPITAYFLARGKVTATLRPFPPIGAPYIHFELEGDATVVPAPGRDAEAAAALAAGHVRITRGGAPAGLGR